MLEQGTVCALVVQVSLVTLPTDPPQGWVVVFSLQGQGSEPRSDWKPQPRTCASSCPAGAGHGGFLGVRTQRREPTPWSAPLWSWPNPTEFSPKQP